MYMADFRQIAQLPNALLRNFYCGVSRGCVISDSTLQMLCTVCNVVANGSAGHLLCKSATWCSMVWSALFLLVDYVRMYVRMYMFDEYEHCLTNCIRVYK